MMFRLAALLLLVSSSSNALTESRNRLPLSLSNVVSDLSKEGATQVSTACLIPSRTVTAAAKQSVLEGVLGGEPVGAGAKVSASSSSGLAVCQPTQLDEVVSSAVACQGSVIYVPSATDLQQGEGLMELLAPAMEQLIKAGDSSKGSLVVVCDKTLGAKKTQAKLEAAAKPILETMNVQSLEDVFGSVSYVTAADKVSAALQKTDPESAMAHVKTVSEGALAAPCPWGIKIAQQPVELAAARKLVSLQRSVVDKALQLVQDATASNTALVTDFGALLDATLQQAEDTFSQGTSKKLLGTAVGKQLSAGVSAELASEWMDAYEKQLVLLQEASFATFRQSLGKLRLGPTLAHDMTAIVQETVSTFGKTVKGLLPKSSTAASTVWKTRAKDSQAALSRRLTEFCKDRLLAAEASGQFKPVPRKGVTVGMHWLLPKPFGNDFRQEPWMTHATDNMVYVPRRSTKVTEVPEESVLKTGDWRDEVVPSPPGRDMVFMQ